MVAARARRYTPASVIRYMRVESASSFFSRCYLSRFTGRERGGPARGTLSCLRSLFSGRLPRPSHERAAGHSIRRGKDAEFFTERERRNLFWIMARTRARAVRLTRVGWDFDIWEVMRVAWGCNTDVGCKTMILDRTRLHVISAIYAELYIKEFYNFGLNIF